MDNIMQICEEYRAVRRQIVGSIVSTCRLCFNVAWTDYYGRYVCRDCCSFFAKSIYYTAEYRCIGDGECIFDRKHKNKCHFCWFKKCFRSGLKSARFGNNYLHDNRDARIRNRVRPVLSPETFRQIREFAVYLDWNSMESCDRFFLPIVFPYLKGITPRRLLRYTIALIIRRSVYVHGNLMLKRSFMDPYKCKILSLQRLAIEILEMMERIEDENLIIDVALMRMIIFVEGIYTRDNVINYLRQKMLRVENLINDFRTDIVYYAQDVLQR